MNGAIESHRDLVAWQKCFQLGVVVCKLAAKLPRNEQFGLASQMRRSAVSIASNIAEGYGRQSTQEYVRFLRIARGSLCEVDTQIEFSRELGYISAKLKDKLSEHVNECGRILGGLIRSLERRLK